SMVCTALGLGTSTVKHSGTTYSPEDVSIAKIAGWCAQKQGAMSFLYQKFRYTHTV
ncbi:hypothetical protein HispidOSU_025028, partial [Sigmodon hispidus]